MNPSKPTVRCAIYTRKSTEEGLQQDFNTLDAQRESAEAYILAHKHEGWIALPDRYDDGGFTGGNLDRPAFKRLMRDVENGKVDAIVVYKIDRLSRSLLDFSRVMEILERHNVALIAITQSLDTKTSMGRLTLNILLSFAQFEREIISERTRDKIAAARRKGRWSGGRALLGYNIESLPGGSRLIVNEAEAALVRAIFELYLHHGSLMPVVQELALRDWKNKAWVCKKNGEHRPAQPFTKSSLFALLTNITYIGKTRYKTEVHPGQHEAIVSAEVFDKVQATLRRNGRSGSPEMRNKYGALLRGLLECETCRLAMTHAYTAKGSKRYRYYVCAKAQKQGWHACQTKSVPAQVIEDYVVQQVKRIGNDPELARAAVQEARKAAQEKLGGLNLELGKINQRVTGCQTQLKRAGQACDPHALITIQQQIDELSATQKELIAQIDETSASMVNEEQAIKALSEFDGVWLSLSPREQAKLLTLLIKRVSYNGQTQAVKVSFLPSAISTLQTTEPRR